MSFTKVEIEYLLTQPLARLATVGRDGSPQVKPVGFVLDRENGQVVIGAYEGAGMLRHQKFRNIEANPEVAMVIDDVVTDPWSPRGVEIRGRAEARREGGAEVGTRQGAPFPYDPAWILVTPRRILSWGLEGSATEMNARDVA